MKLLNLADNHFIYKATSEVAKIAAPFFERYGFNYFQYGRIYKDGSAGILVNDVDWIKAYYAERRPVLSHINHTKISDGVYQFLWNGNLPEDALGFAQQFQHDYGLCHIEIQENYYDLISFAAPTENYQVRDIYINDLDLIKNFIFYFRDRGAKLLTKMEENTIHLPKQMQDQNQSEIFNGRHFSGGSEPFSPKRYHFMHRNQATYITRQEYLTLKHLAMGYSQQETAYRLNNSHRTTETYLTRMRQRLECYNMRDLIQLYFKYL